MIGPQITGNNWGASANAVSNLDLTNGGTEDVVRDIFTDHASDKIVFIPGQGYAYFEDSIWKKDKNEIRAKQLADDIPRLLRQKAREYFWDPQIEKKFSDAASQYSTAKSRASIVRAAKHHPKLQFNAKFEGEHSELLSLGNGVFDLDKGALRSLNSGEHLTLRSPVVYDSEAKCPLWERFVAKITGGDAEKAAYLQRLAGSTLINRNGNCLLLQGGDEDLQVFIKTISQVLGGYGAFTTSRNLFTRQSTPPEFSKNFRNRRLIFCESSPGRNRREQNILPMLDSAWEAILYTVPKCTMPSLWVVLKHGTRLDTSNERVWNDTQVFTFESSPAEASSLVGKGFREEYSGILNWILVGYRMFKHNGFAPPQSLTDEKNQIRRTVDPIWHYCNRICVQGAGLRVGSTALYSHFKKWCQAFGYLGGSHKSFSIKAQEFFGETGKNGIGNKYFDGVAIGDSSWEEFMPISVPNRTTIEVFQAGSQENILQTEEMHLDSGDELPEDWFDYPLEVSDYVRTDECLDED